MAASKACLVSILLLVSFTKVARPSDPTDNSPNGDLLMTFSSGTSPSATLSTSAPSTTPKPKPCKKTCTSNGKCDPESGKCKCNPGWMGDRCHLCGGKVKLNTTEGWLADAVGNYTVDSKCTWLIEAPRDDSTIRLHLKEFATECGWDHLYVFDGDSVFSDLVGVLSGMVRQDRYAVQRVPELVGRSGNMLVHFYSDVAYNMTGFNITFSIDSCPSQRHDLTCSGHGSCVKGSCQCDQDYKGEACNVPACPQNCEPHGERRGICNTELKRCECLEGWAGEACSQAESSGYWETLNVVGTIPPPRTSHAAMVDNAGRLWIVGGETFSNTRHMVAVFSPDLENKDNKGLWRPIKAEGNKGPSARFGHSSVIHDNKIYMYGGTMKSGHVSKELWALDLVGYQWERVETSQGICMSSESAQLCGPINSMGHTANVITNRMIVIFGHSPKYGYLDTVQQYHFTSKEWSILETSGYPVRGGFGHTSVWDDITNRIYVYGGYVSTASTAAQITNDIYSFDPMQAKWQRHTPSSSYRYLHSAVASSGHMIVFGGNTHNDTSTSHGAKCYSADVLAYDMVCDKWYNMGKSLPADLDVDLPRFGHSASILDGKMILHGGFHGVLKNDLIMYVPGNCAMFKSRNKCLGAVAGQKCTWNSKKSACETHPPHRAKPGFDTCIQASKDVNQTDICSTLKTCSACTSTSFGCVWCQNDCKWRSCHENSNIASRRGRFNSGFSDDNGKNSDGDGRISAPTFKASISSEVHHPSVSRSDQCPGNQATSPKESCPRLHTCHSCLATPGCEWDLDKVSHCKQIKKRIVASPPSPKSKNITDHSDLGSKLLRSASSTRSELIGPTCSPACSERTTCTNCTHGLCMWCKNLGMCIDRNAYLASFPYGQCMDWTTQQDQCPLSTKNDTATSEDVCAGYATCASCRSNPSCGWCDNGEGTGIGTCMMGGASSPLIRVKHPHGHAQWVAADTCQVSAGKSWHFTSCPDCMCNGHSTCSKDPKKCDQPCRDNTEGENCEKCAKGYFGFPVNGGKCEACQCNGQAKECNHQTGRCHCTTKGIIGEKCQSCDKVNHYYGDPIKDSCYYDLAIDYQFTFNLSKVDDKHLRGINFKNTPTKSDVDVDFSVTCSVPAKMNLTVKYATADGDLKEKHIVMDQNCTLFKTRFSKDEFVFGVNENTTFYVYVYDFEPPLWIIISFSQHPKLDLLQFFITFSTCFLALLLVAAILWKIKQKFDRYRRRQRLFVEMEQMASRPFGSVLVELEKVSDHANSSSSSSGIGPSTSASIGTISDHHGGGTGSRMKSSGSGSVAVSGGTTSTGGVVTSTTSSGNREESSNVRRRRKRPRPSPIALEPCVGNRAAVLSLIVRMPTGGKPYTPNGYTGIAIASSLVTLGNPRKPSSDNATKASLDDPKSGRKGRKSTSAQSTDI